MRTQVIAEHAVKPAWLECLSDGVGVTGRTEITKSPFILGRGESADLQIDSTRVSREHAAVVRVGPQGFRLRDLGSTNGTFLNGKRVKDAQLDDGDLVMVANIEFAFSGGPSGGARNSVTQIMEEDPDHVDASGWANAGSEELLRQLRSTREQLLCGCAACRLEPITELANGHLFGHTVCDDSGGQSQSLASDLPDLTVPSRTLLRLAHTRRMRAIEQSLALASDMRIFLPIEGWELAFDNLTAIVGTLALGDVLRQRLVVELPCPSEDAQAPVLSDQVRELGLEFAWTGISGREGRGALEGAEPRYLKLASTLVRQAPRSAEPRRAIQNLVRRGRERGWEVIAEGIRSRDERDACQELGCVFGQGSLFTGQPREAAPPASPLPRLSASWPNRGVIAPRPVVHPLQN